MNQYLEKLKKRISYYNKSEGIPYEEKNFYVTMLCSIPIVFLVFMAFVKDGTNPMICLYCAVIMIYAVIVTAISILVGYNIRNSYNYCFFFNFVISPSMFLMSEGIYYGMAMFFVLSIVLTVVLLGTKKVVIPFVIAEMVYDILLVMYTYFHDYKVYMHQSNMNQEDAIAFSFGITGITIISLFLYQNFMHKDTHKQVEKDNESITKAENTKGRFLANMTHEIRTPMNAIIGMTDLILKEDLQKSTREYTDTIKTASAQLLQIINNILEFSKLDSGRAELINNEYSFKKLVQEIVDNIATIYSKQNVELNVFVKKDIPDRLFGDDVRIKQVLRYLLLSPLIRDKNGNVNLDINYDYDIETRIITLSVRIASTGNGLTNDEMTAIYNAYSNYDSRQKTNYNRTGLEFSICKNIVNMMGGDIEIDSIEGIGNAVEFTFDNYVVDDKPICSFNVSNDIFTLVYLADSKSEFLIKKLMEEMGVAVTYVNSSLGFRNVLEKRNFSSIFIPDSVYQNLKEYIGAFECEEKVYVIANNNNCIGDFGKCRILRRPFYLFNLLEAIGNKYDESKYKDNTDIEEVRYPYARVLCVDDSTVNLKVLESLLHDYGIMPRMCTSGKEALDILNVDEFDILFIDQKMPEMDGIELVHNIKKLNNSNSAIPSICATADFGNDIKEELKLQGFADYLAKPINKIYLEKTLRDYLPEDLRVVIKHENKKADNASKKNKKDEVEVNPLEFNSEVGVANLGGNKEAYISVLSAYYNEGVGKLTEVPQYLRSGDISLYTTNVHALKSSSATVGCVGISPLFKALEMAGKDNNTDYINENSDKVFGYLTEILNKVREYLISENAFETDSEDGNISEDTRDVVEIDKALLDELSQCILTMNLRRSEEIIDELLSNNYGAEINAKVKDIKKAYDNFEYIEIKTIIEELV